MTTLRCTSKVLQRLHLTNAGEPPPSTSALGDWYVNLFHTRHVRLVIFVSEVTRLPVILSARNFAELVPGFHRAAIEVLSGLRALRCRD